MSGKPERFISVFIEDLTEVPRTKGRPQPTSVRIRHAKKVKEGGEYVPYPTEQHDLLMALVESAAIALAETDDVAEEAMNNTLTFCNILLGKVAEVRGLVLEDTPQLTDDFDEIPDDLRKQIAMLVPAAAEWRNRH